MTPQQERILYALTREGMPRTVENMAVETGMPQPSIRRTISELRASHIINQDGKVYSWRGRRV